MNIVWPPNTDRSTHLQTYSLYPLYTRIHASIHPSIHPYMHMRPCIHASMHTCTHAYMHNAFIQSFMHACIHTYMPAHSQTTRVCSVFGFNCGYRVLNKLVIGCTVHFIGQFHATSIVAGRMQEVGIEKMMTYNKKNARGRAEQRRYFFRIDGHVFLF